MRELAARLLDRPGIDPTLPPRAYLLFGLATVLGLAHHVDHVVRGNHVGWPVTGSVNAFTFSLVVYPVIAFGLVLAAYGRGRADYWLGVGVFGLALLAWIHVSPWAIEPPSEVIGPHDSRVVGLLAFGVVLGLLGALAVTAAVALRETVADHRGRLAESD